MKLRTIRYLVKEGFSSTFKNTLMFLASTITVTASLIILGIFVLIGSNVNSISKKIETNLLVQVFLDPEMKQDKIDEIGRSIKNLNIGRVTFVTKDQAFKRLKNMDMVKGHEKLLEGYDERNNFLPSSYMITLGSAENAKKAVDKLKNIPGVNPDDVIYHKDVVDKIIKIANVIRIVSLVVLVFLAATSILIISNTVKLTVFARRKEIGIMKYIGATDFFIHLPFVIESMVIGAISSVLALVVIFESYQGIISYLKVKSVVNDIGINSFVGFNTLSLNLFIIYLIIGVGMGCVGTSISMRKYLKV